MVAMREMMRRLCTFRGVNAQNLEKNRMWKEEQPRKDVYVGGYFKLY